MNDPKYIVLIESTKHGELYFGPYVTEEKAQLEGARFGKAGVFWSVWELQPGNYAAEWRRIFKESPREQEDSSL